MENSNTLKSLQEKTAIGILDKHLDGLNTKANNRAPIETQLTLLVQAALLAMDEYASLKVEQALKDNSVSSLEN